VLKSLPRESVGRAHLAVAEVARRDISPLTLPTEQHPLHGHSLGGPADRVAACPLSTWCERRKVMPEESALNFEATPYAGRLYTACFFGGALRLSQSFRSLAK
jgi:hypothetical protein